MDQLKNTLRDRAKEIQEEIRGHRRHLHMNPEIGFDLFQTHEYVKKQLEDMGYETETCAGTGLIALVGVDNPGKTFILRADMDALPIQEETNLDFRSKNDGKMHACGHDMHTAMLLGAAKILKEVEEKIPGTIKLMFQPAEELLSGAKAMLDDGVLENPKPDAGMAIHVETGTDIDIGRAVIRHGVAMASSHTFRINIKGKSGHCSTPDAAIDAANIAIQIGALLNTIQSKDLSMYSQAVFNIGKISSGDSFSVIPGEAEILGTFRTFSDLDSSIIEQRIKDISEGVTSIYKGEVKVTINVGGPRVVNDLGLVDIADNILKDLYDDESIYLEKPETGSEDFGWLSKYMPTLMLNLYAGSIQEGQIEGLHHPNTMFDDSVLHKGSTLLATVAIDWLDKN